MSRFLLDERLMATIEKNNENMLADESTMCKSQSLQEAVKEALKNFNLSNSIEWIYDSSVETFLYLDGTMSVKYKKLISEYVANKTGKNLERVKVVAFSPET